jgi:hypothetical protein
MRRPRGPFESPAESRASALILGQSNQGLRNFHKMPDVVVILAQEDCARIKKGDHDVKL